MNDEELRDAERQQHLGHHARTRYLHQRVRHGTLTHEKLGVAALCGDPEASCLTGTLEATTWDALCEGLGSGSHEPAILAVWFAAAWCRSQMPLGFVWPFDRLSWALESWALYGPAPLPVYHELTAAIETEGGVWDGSRNWFVFDGFRYLWLIVIRWDRGLARKEAISDAMTRFSEAVAVSTLTGSWSVFDWQIKEQQDECLAEVRRKLKEWALR